MMLRKFALFCVVPAFVLAGCDKPSSDDGEIHMDMPRATNSIGITRPYIPPPNILIQGMGPNVLFSVQHDLTVTMPHDSVAVRFAAARDACLKDKSLHCTLTSASMTVRKSVNAQLEVALPHDQVQIFEKRLLKRLPQDGDGKAEIASRSSTVQNETTSSADITRQLSQAKAYRDSLEVLAKRSNLTVGEVIKIHSELIEAQTAVDNAEAAKRAMDSNIVLEKMSITLEEAIVLVQKSPFDGFWKNARTVFVASSAEMLLRIVNVIPWLPIALVLAWLVARFMRRLQRRRTPASS